MFLRKNRLAFFTVVMIALLLAACGETEKGSKEEEGNLSMEEKEQKLRANPRNFTREDFDIYSLSEALEKNSVWIKTDEDITRDSKVSSVFVFEDDNVQHYKTSDGDLTIEEMIDMEDNKLVEHARKISEQHYDEKVDQITSTAINYESSPVGAALARQVVEQILDKNNEIPDPAKIDPITEDIYSEVADERPDPTSTYSLDIKIDDKGQHTENMDLKISDAKYKLNNDVRNLFQDYESFIYSLVINGIDHDNNLLDNPEGYSEAYEKFINKLEEKGSFEENDKTDFKHPQNFVPDPLTWEIEDMNMTLERSTSGEKIFDTTFTGFSSGSGSFVTRVDNLFVKFEFDDPDTNKDNVTIEEEE